MLYAHEAKDRSTIFRENIMEDELCKAKNKIEKYIEGAVNFGNTKVSVPLAFTCEETMKAIETWITGFGYDIDWYDKSSADHYLEIYWYNA